MRWFYGFLLMLLAWGAFERVILSESAPQWRTWEQPR